MHGHRGIVSSNVSIKWQRVLTYVKELVVRGVVVDEMPAVPFGGVAIAADGAGMTGGM